MTFLLRSQDRSSQATLQNESLQPILKPQLMETIKHLTTTFVNALMQKHFLLNGTDKILYRVKYFNAVFVTFKQNMPNVGIL